MIDIVHFYPTLKVSKIFVSPLIDIERKNGLISVAINSKGGSYSYFFNIELKNILWLLYSFIKITLTLIDSKPKIIISHNTRSSLLPLLSAKMIGVNKKIYINHGVPFIGHKGLTRLILLLIEKINCLLADEIVTVSNDMVKILKRITKKKINIINNGSACGIDLNIIKRCEPNEFRSKFKFKKSDVLFAYIGRHETRKGFNFIIDLWKNYLNNNKKLKLLIFGGTSQKPKSLQNNKNIFYLGYSNDIAEVLTGIDCVFIPSSHEGLSYIAIEASIIGCPIIANNIPGIKNIVNHNVSGFLVKPNNCIEYIKSIKKILNKKLNLKKIKKNSKIISKKYDRKSFAPKYIKFIKQNLNS